jgi:hypothetical protein
MAPRHEKGTEFELPDSVSMQQELLKPSETARPFCQEKVHWLWLWYF